MRLSFKIILLFFGLTIINSCKDDVPEDSCPKVEGLNFYSTSSRIEISYYAEGVNSYKIEYGLTGFNEGSGETFITSNTNFEIDNLTPSTTYDVYVTSICSSTESSKSVGLYSITTDQSLCDSTNSSINIYQYSLSNISVNIDSSGENSYEIVKYELEYGIEGFTQGSGTLLDVQSNGVISITDFQPNTTYDFYYRANCSGNDYGDYKFAQYTTLSSCPEPTNVSVSYQSGSCSNGSASYYFNWDYYSGADIVNYSVSIRSTGQEPYSSFTTTNTHISLTNFYCGSRDFYVRANCNNGGTSDWYGPFPFL